MASWRAGSIFMLTMLMIIISVLCFAAVCIFISENIQLGAIVFLVLGVCAGKISLGLLDIRARDRS